MTRIGRRNLSWIKMESRLREDKTIKPLRSFGLLVGGVFALMAAWPVLFRGQPLRTWAMVAAAGLVVPALLLPKILGPVYRVWMAFGHILGWINTRIVLGIVFFLVFTPVGIVMRLFGKDPLRLRLKANSKTHRIPRMSRPESHMKQQF
jgi:predicted membrane metal-binding protein